MPHLVAIAGSSHKTLTCTQALIRRKDFSIGLVITPKAKPMGKKKLIEPNPMEVYAQTHNLPIIFVDNRLEKSDFEQYLSKNFAFLLVVDFGYLIPTWLLNWPKIAAVNVHPSALPRWRGSAPGQMVLLNGESTSAVSLIKLDQQLDRGPIISQYPFEVNPTWTQLEYYQHSFNLMAQHLGNDLLKFSQGQIKPMSQPDLSPTPIAKKLNKADSFVSWQELLKVITKQDKKDSTLIHSAQKWHQACKAYSPWPMLWTIIPTVKGEKRMKIIQTHLENHVLILGLVQIEGQKPAHWHQVKNILV